MRRCWFFLILFFVVEGFSLDWLSLDGDRFSFLLETRSGQFALISPRTNYLYYEGRSYPPTSLLQIFNGEEWREMSLFSEPFWKKTWTKTNSLLYAQISWGQVIYSFCFLLTNRGSGSPFLVAACHISNASSEAVEVGFRYLLDTTLGEDGFSPLFWFENGVAVNTEMEIFVNQYGDYFISGDEKKGLFMQPAYNGLSPRVIYLANYHRLKTARNDIHLESSANFLYGSQGRRDGAILVEYRYRLRPAESLEGGVVMALEGFAPLRWNQTLFDFFPPPPHVAKTNITSQGTHTDTVSRPSSFSLTNRVYLTNTISVSPGDTQYLLLQQALLERLERLVQTLSQPTVGYSLTNVGSTHIITNQGRTLSPSQQPGWFPHEDPFASRRSSPTGKNVSSAHVSSGGLDTPSPNDSKTPSMPKESPTSSPLTPVKSENVSPVVFFVTNVITNYVTREDEGIKSQATTAVVKNYEERLQILQKQLLEMEKQTTGREKTSARLQLIEKRLELLNWLLERISQVSLKAEDIARMNQEIEILLQDFGGAAP